MAKSGCGNSHAPKRLYWTPASLDCMAGKQIGDPVRGAAAILAAVDADTPPLQLLLGSDALRSSAARRDDRGDGRVGSNHAGLPRGRVSLAMAIGRSPRRHR